MTVSVTDSERDLRNSVIEEIGAQCDFFREILYSVRPECKTTSLDTNSAAL
jgi:hypothetical protein